MSETLEDVERAVHESIAWAMDHPTVSSLTILDGLDEEEVEQFKDVMRELLAYYLMARRRR